MIIDCHAHLEPRMLATDQLMSRMDAAGVDRVVLIPTMMDPLPETPEGLLSLMRKLMGHAPGRALTEVIHRATLDSNKNLRLGGKTYNIYKRPDNETVVDLVRRHPERFLGWIFLNPGEDSRCLETLEQYRAVKGMVGIKLHPHWHDYKTDVLGPLLKRAEELKMPVLIHLGFRKRGNFGEICEQFPNLTVISAHAGFPFYKDLWAYKSRYPNLHVDLSSPYIDEKLARAAVKAMGPERCLYGTDAPYGFHDDSGSYNYREIRGWIERMPVRADESEAILGGNFQQILNQSGIQL